MTQCLVKKYVKFLSQGGTNQVLHFTVRLTVKLTLLSTQPLRQAYNTHVTLTWSGNYLVHDWLVSKQFAYNMTVCKAGTLMVFTK